MGKWFNEEMTSNEMAKILFSFTKQRFEKNKEEILKEYKEVLPKVTKKENDLAEEGWIL